MRRSTSVFVLAIALFVSIVQPGAGEQVAPRQTPLRFIDVTEEAGLAEILDGALHHAVAWGDFDGDGRLDLFLGNFSDRGPKPAQGIRGPVPNTLYRQVEGGRFMHFPCPPVEIMGRASGAVFADLNNNGHLDLYVASNRLPNMPTKEPQRTAQQQTSRLYRNDGGGQFVDISDECGACLPTLFRCRDIGVFDYDGDGLLDLLVLADRVTEYEGKTYASRMFRNLGEMKFVDVTRQVGLPEDLWGLGIAVADLNDDGRPDFFVCGSNKLFLSQPDQSYKEAEGLGDVFDHQPTGPSDIVTGGVFGDLNRDGRLDLITGPHDYNGPSRVHVFLNEGRENGSVRFREITAELGIPVIHQKAPHPEIQDFDNDGLPDLYWSAWYEEQGRRWPYICRGLGNDKQGRPRFQVPTMKGVAPFVRGEPSDEGLHMIYYVNGPAVDYDGDGRLDFFGGSWGRKFSRLHRNVSDAGNWVKVQVEGKTINRMGLGSKVRIYAAGKAGQPEHLLGYQEITVNGGYSSGRPALVHFGLGERTACDIQVTIPRRQEPIVLERVSVNQTHTVREPR